MKKSKALCFVLVIALAVCCFLIPDAGDEIKVTAAGDITELTPSDIEYGIYELDGKDVVAIFSYNGNYKKISIPEEIDGYPVGYLEYSSFGSNDYLEYVELPSTISFISGGVFDGSYLLQEIAISANNPYYTCVDGVLYNKDVTTLVAFPGGRSGEFTVPETVVSIGDMAFSYCRNITKVRMYNNVEYIGTNAFEGCQSLSEIRLSDNLKTLSFRALYNCSNLEEIHLPYSLENIHETALVGGIDSEDNVYYHTVNGIYYVKGSYAETFVKSLDLPTKYLIAEPRTVTDIDTNTVLYDSEGLFPEGKKIDISVQVLPNSTYESLLPARFVEMVSYRVSFYVDGVATTLKKPSVIKFNSLSEDSIPTATKVFVYRSGSLVEKTRAPQAAFVGTTFSGTDTFIVINNNDFSLKGDIDGDGVHSIYDARFALSLAANLVKDITPAQKQTADVDGENGINTVDAYEILCYAAGIK